MRALQPSTSYNTMISGSGSNDWMAAAIFYIKGLWQFVKAI